MSNGTARRYGCVCLALLAFALVSTPAPRAWAGEPGAARSRAATWYDTIRSRLKARAIAPVAPRMAEESFREAPVLTWLMGWDFDNHCWKLNEYENQLSHMFIGGLLNPILGRRITFYLAVAIEVQQYFGKDAHNLELPDRIRDIAFYMVP